jgi:hypothetical protein
MPTRYYKATDGARTVFRSTAGRVYRSAALGRREIRFSAAFPGPGTHPAVEIGEREYNRLVELKNRRLKSAGIDHLRWGAPGQSWVANVTIEMKAQP